MHKFAARLLFAAIYHRRPARGLGRIAGSLLVQIAGADGSVPPQSAAKTAVRARAIAHRYPCDHFDVYPSATWHPTVLADQLF